MISGNIQYKPLTTPPAGPPGPPFAPTSADNGLSVDAVTGRIVLGNDLGGVAAMLTNFREIPLNGFFIDFSSASEHIEIQPASLRLISGNAGYPSSVIFGTTFGTPAYAVSDRSLGAGDFLVGNEFGGNGSHLSIDDALQTFLLETTLQRYLFASPQTYGFGELLGAFNGSQIGIDDANQAFDFQTITSGHLFNISGISGNASLGDLDFNITGFQMFLDYTNQHMNVITGAFPGSRLFDLNSVAGVYQMGDIDGLGSGLRTEIDATNTRYRVLSTAGAMLDFLQPGGGIYEFGDVDGGFNQTKISLDDFNQFATIAGGGTMLSLNKSAGLYQIGDIQPDTNGNTLSIDDIANLFRIENTAMNAGISINGVAGFTGTVAPVNTITVNNGIVTAVA